MSYMPATTSTTICSSQRDPYYYNRNVERGEPPIQPSGKYQNILFDNEAIRAAFIRKVFLIITAMLLTVAAISLLPYAHPGFMQFMTENLKGLFYAALILYFGIILVITCFEAPRRRYPTNIILTAIFAIATGVLNMVLISFYSFPVIAQALGTTIVACIGITIWAATTKQDLTKCFAFVIISSFCLLFSGSILLIFRVAGMNVDFAHMIYCVIGVLLFMFYLAFDIQLLMGGKRIEISPEDYVFAALQIFIDIMQIFWYLLSIFARASN